MRVGLALLAVSLAVPALAQRPGGGQRRAGSQRQMGQQAPPQQGQQQRQRTRATQQQQQQYRVCTDAMNRVRSRIREMARLAAAQALDVEQMQLLEEQLRSELQAMAQEQAQLTADLSEEQKSAAQDQLGKIAKGQEDLESFSEALGFELEQANLDEAQVREQVKKLDAAAKQLQKQQQELGSELEME
jgi:chromosome segregation ATPase